MGLFHFCGAGKTKLITHHNKSKLENGDETTIDTGNGNGKGWCSNCSINFLILGKSYYWNGLHLCINCLENKIKVEELKKRIKNLN